MTIENFIYVSDRYRKSTFETPYPLPMTRKVVDEQMRLDEDFRQEIGKTMAVYGVRAEWFAQIYEMTKPGYPGGEKKIVTLLVRFWGIELPADWSGLRDELKSKLVQSGKRNIEVELLDEKQCYQPSIFPIDSDSNAARAYEAVREKLIKILDKHLEGHWNLMSLFNLGRTSDLSRPTIVVMVNLFSSADWKLLIQLFERELPSDGVDGMSRIWVDFLPGTVNEETLHEACGVDIRTRFSRLPGLGASLGVEGVDNGAGTMGGVVHLRAGGKTYAGLITNHHVIKPADDAPEADRKEAAMGYCFDPLAVNRPACEVPSRIDFEATRAAIEAEINDTEEVMRRNEEKRKIETALGADPTRLMQAYERLDLLRQSSVESMHQIERSKISVGRVLVSSGYLISSNSAKIDWAFVGDEISDSPPRFADGRCNRLPALTSHELKNQLPRDWGKIDMYPVTEARPECPVGFGRMLKDRWYIKVGRTTDVTAGICNGVQADVPWQRVLHYDEQGNGVEITSGRIRPWVVIKKKDSFCLPGDSGSLVVDSELRVSGLVYGNLDGRCGGEDCFNAGLITCFSDILRSIQERTTVKDENGIEIKGELLLPAMPAVGT